jgi:hypothetical protein
MDGRHAKIHMNVLIGGDHSHAARFGKRCPV